MRKLNDVLHWTWLVPANSQLPPCLHGFSCARVSWSPSDKKSEGIFGWCVEHMPTASLKSHKVLDIDTLSCLIWNWWLWTMTFRFERNNRSRSQLPSDDYTSVASPWLCMSWSAIGVLEMVRWSLARQEEFMEAVEQELVSWNLMKQHLIGFIKT